MAHQIKLPAVYHLLSKAASNVLYVRYFKKSNGVERHMIFRIGGSDDRSGAALPIHRVLDDVKSEVLTVWDLNKNAYRRINLQEVVSLVVDQEEYVVVP